MHDKIDGVQDVESLNGSIQEINDLELNLSGGVDSLQPPGIEGADGLRMSSKLQMDELRSIS